jgi:transposase
MDIDTTQKGKTPGNACCCCGSAGHWAKDCHLWFDVCYMDTDEVETALEDKLAAKYVVPVEPQAEDKPLPPVSVEDFVSRSK